MATEVKIDYRGVKSSNVDKVGYDEATKTLGVVFKNGGAYHYADVPKSVYDALLAADSVGAYIHAHVKGRFSHSKA